MAKNNKRKCNIPIFIPHRGCPNDCAFCNQKKITGVQTDISPEEVKEIIKNALSTIGDKTEVEVAFFGGSFTGIERGLQESFLRVAADFFPRISGIRLSTRADYIDEDIIALLLKYGVTAVELGVQSTDETVLKKNLRGHNFECVKKAANLLKENGFETGLQMMVGMFGSDFQKDIKTAEDIISLKPQTTRIYPTVVLKDTKLEEYYRKGEYTPYSTEEAVEVCKEVYKRFDEANVRVLRLGLHSSEELDKSSYVAGPYHPAFGELVFSRLFRDKIEDEILKNGLKDCEYKVSAEPKDVSKITGQNKSNLIYFKEKYNISLKIVPKEKG